MTGAGADEGCGQVTGRQGQHEWETEAEMEGRSAEAAVSNSTSPPPPPPQPSWPLVSAPVWPPSLQATGDTFQPRWRSALALVATLTGSSVHPGAGAEPSGWAEGGRSPWCQLHVTSGGAEPSSRCSSAQHGGGPDPEPRRPAQGGPCGVTPALRRAGCGQ